MSSDLSFPDVDVLELAPLEDLEAHVALPHEEQLLALLQVVVLTLVRPSHVEDLHWFLVSLTNVKLGFERHRHLGW